MEKDTDEHKMKVLITADMVDFADKCAHKFQKDYSLPLEDLQEAAYLGLCRAARNFQPEKGGTFKSLAFKHIWKQIQKQVQKLKAHGLQTISLDKLLDWEEGMEQEAERDGLYPTASFPADLEDSLSEEDDNFRRFEEENHSRIVQLLQLLTPREREIIRSYFGLDTEPRSLREIGDKLQVSKGRVQQIYEKAILKMRKYTLNPKNAHEKH